jgi:hypothetical protein
MFVSAARSEGCVEDTTKSILQEVNEKKCRLLVSDTHPTQTGKQLSRATMRVENVSLPRGKVEDPPQGRPDTTLGAATGTRRMTILLLKCSDDTTGLHDASYYENLTGSFPGNKVNAFYQVTSWGQLTIQAGTTPGWLMLLHPKSWYAPRGWSGASADLDVIGNDGITLADGIANFAGYDLISLVLTMMNLISPSGGGTTDPAAGGSYWYGSYFGISFCDGSNRVFFPTIGVWMV